MSFVPETHQVWLKRSYDQQEEHANRCLKDAAGSRDTRDQHIRALTQAFTAYALTGVGRRPDDYIYIKEGQRGRFAWHRYFANLAREMRRPYVWFNQYGDHAQLHIAKRKYCAPLMSSLWLVGHKADVNYHSHYMRHREGPGVFYGDVGDRTEFWFNGADALALAEAHVATFHVDPDKRRALRL